MSEGGIPFASKYPGIMKQMIDGTRVGLRIDAEGTPTIDIHNLAIPGGLIDLIKLKFP